MQRRILSVIGSVLVATCLVVSCVDLDSLGAGIRADAGVGPSSDAPSSDDGGPGASHGPAYLFATGGADDPWNPKVAASTKTFRAVLNQNGTLGAWTSGPDLPSPRLNHGVLGVGQSLFVLGGAMTADDLSSNKTVFSLDVLEDGGTTDFRSEPPLSVGTLATRPVIAGERVYVFKASVDAVNIARINGHSLGTWQEQDGVVGAGSAYYGCAAAVENQVFWFGPGTRALASTLASDGTLAPWRTLPPTPVTITNGQPIVVALGRRLYMVGASFVDVGSNLVYVAEVATDGTLGPWVSTEPFPIVRQGHGAVAAGGYVYVLGGLPVSGATAGITAVWSAHIKPDGMLDSWNETSALPEWHTFAFGAVAP